MSGAASIAAAKNRRTKADPNQKPIISCSSKSGASCPLPPGSKTTKSTPPTLFDEESLQIKGPMHLMQVLQIHEQRLNKIDDKLSRQLSLSQQVSTPQTPCITKQACIQEPQACDAECYDRISTLEEKVHMLEEVIMNLQLTLTNVQSFAMETSLAMLKLQNQVTACPAPAVTLPTTPAQIEEPIVLSVSETN